MPSMIGLFSAKADLNENGLLQKMGLYAGESDIRYRFQSEGIDIAILSNIKWPAEDPYACNSSQKVEIVLFGECYNTNIERDQIYRSAGVEVKKNTDAELVLAAFLSRDKDNLARLNGQYYAVISEKKSGNFFVLMDRYGVSRLYYTFVPDGLAISGKVRSFLAMPDFVTEPNIEGFHSQLKFGFLMAQESMLKNVNLFPNATLTEYSDGKLKFHKYWDVPQQVDPSNFLNEEESVEELSILMRNGLKKMRRGDYREGFQLSGGLDSRVILSSTDPEEREFLTLTFGLPECYDIRIAKMITSKLRVDHKVFPLDWDVIENNAHQTIWDSDGEGSILLADTLYFSQGEEKEAQPPVAEKAV
ncbi:hypothetical protein H8D57_00275, partial [bacterium]|nr:hypothetical protein [bacterium]